MEERTIIDQYLKEVRKVLYLPSKYKKEVLEELKHEIQFYLDKNPECDTYENLVDHFHTPSELVREYIENAGMTTDYDKAKKHSLVMRIVIGVLGVLLAVSLIWILFFLSAISVSVHETITIYQNQ